MHAFILACLHECALGHACLQARSQLRLLGACTHARVLTHEGAHADPYTHARARVCASTPSRAVE
eukprot:1235270-Alexandrium_andersonii.AAC.1